MFGTGYIRSAHLLAAVGTLLAVFLVAQGVAADAIHLKNGRTIHTSQTRVEGDRLYFIQYGGEVSIPLSLVERVVEDEQSGPEARPTPPAGTPAEGEAPEGEEATAADEEAATEEAEEEVPEQQTREYWQERRRQITDRIDALEDQIEELRREERAFLFSHRSTAHVRRQIEQVEAELQEHREQLASLREEARRAGVPPGWVRE